MKMGENDKPVSIIGSNLRWKRLLIEFVVITAGVYLGLLADNYREFRQDRQAEQEYLQLIAADLNRDREILVALRKRIERKSTRAQEISMSRDERNWSPDSIEKALTELVFTVGYDAQSSTYRGLRDSAQLRLITSPALRARLASYFEVHQPKVERAVTEFGDYQHRVRARVGQHVRLFSPDRFRELRPAQDGPNVVTLLVPIGQLRQDLELMNDIAETGARGFQVVLFISRLENQNGDVTEILLENLR